MITSGYWTLIETGGNQAYIFGTNKRRANVGGSELIHRVGNEWTRQAISDVLGSPAATAAGWQADPVVCASGKALILTSHPECGRAIVSKVTERALREAPGLGVWGVVATEPADPNHIASGPCACAGCQLEGLHEAHATVRQRAGSPLSRFPTLPFHQPCPFTGAPAVTLDVEVSGEDPRPMSAGFHAAFTTGASPRPDHPGPAIARLRDAVCGERPHDATTCPVQTDLNPDRKPGADKLDPVRNDGWIAVIHADGNSIGQLFIDIGRHYQADAPATLGAFSEALNDVTIAAAKAAAEATGDDTAAGGRAPDPTAPHRTKWLLPIIVGGDDLTVICDGRMALDFTARFLTEFQTQAAAHPDLAAVVQDLRKDGPPLTASAGVAFIKPHHSFSDGYELAERLCASAKRLAREHPDCGALDFHVLFDSVGRDLDAIRAALRVDDADGESLRLWSGPVAAPLPGAADPQVPTIAELLAAVRTFTPASYDADGPISRSAAHSLRTAVLRGGTAINEARDRVRLRAASPSAAQAAMDSYLSPPAGLFAGDTVTRTYVIDALALGEVLEEQLPPTQMGATA